jgi:hypothetical protein
MLGQKGFSLLDCLLATTFFSTFVLFYTETMAAFAKGLASTSSSYQLKERSFGPPNADECAIQRESGITLLSCTNGRAYLLAEGK